MVSCVDTDSKMTRGQTVAHRPVSKSTEAEGQHLDFSHEPHHLVEQAAAERRADDRVGEGGIHVESKENHFTAGMSYEVFCRAGQEGRGRFAMAD